MDHSLDARWWISFRYDEDAERPWFLIRQILPAPETELARYSERNDAQKELNRIHDLNAKEPTRMENATTAGEQRRCVHSLPPENCSYCAPKHPQALGIAGHCGKCGAPYTEDITIGFGVPRKFKPSCKCWNV